jgi:hypothetical protein
MDARLFALALFCAEQELKARRAGKPPGPQPWNAELVRALELETATSGLGHPSDAAESDSEATEWVSTREAAVLLGLSKRQAQRLAADLDGRIIGGRWVFPLTAVAEYAEGRKWAS